MKNIEAENQNKDNLQKNLSKISEESKEDSSLLPVENHEEGF